MKSDSMSSMTSSGVDEGHLDIELRELRLAVGALRFIAETARDLEVAVESGDHQELLHLLGRLRQGVEHARESRCWARGSRGRLPVCS